MRGRCNSQILELFFQSVDILIIVTKKNTILSDAQFEDITSTVCFQLYVHTEDCRQREKIQTKFQQTDCQSWLEFQQTSWNMSIQAKTGGSQTNQPKDVCQDQWQEKEDVKPNKCHALQNQKNHPHQKILLCGEISDRKAFFCI